MRMESDTSAIARGLRRRDPDLLDRLIEHDQHRLLRYLVYLSGNRELAEDLFQETWIRVLERGHQYDGTHEFSTWLYAVARNLTIDYLRKKSPLSLDGLMEDEEHAPLVLRNFAAQSGGGPRPLGSRRSFHDVRSDQPFHPVPENLSPNVRYFFLVSQLVRVASRLPWFERCSLHV
jgi:RNA polymerase sigma factor (sigma-70 family)